MGLIAQKYNLAEEEIQERIPSGTATILANRVHWAITYLVQAGLLTRPRRAVVIATDRGRGTYQKYADRIDNAILSQFDEFKDFKNRSRTNNKKSNNQTDQCEKDLTQQLIEETPEERIQAASDELNEALREELLTRIVAADPTFFEHLIIDLMLAMGYGGSGAGRHLGKTADGGVDGVINEDPLGLSIVFLQAKRYSPGNTVGVGQIREFAGALDEKGAVKGVFVTTSNFAGPALEYAERSPKRLILIDGLELTRLLVRYGVGVRELRKVTLCKLDEDYFSIFDA